MQAADWVPKKTEKKAPRTSDGQPWYEEAKAKEARVEAKEPQEEGMAERVRCTKPYIRGKGGNGGGKAGPSERG